MTKLLGAIDSPAQALEALAPDERIRFSFFHRPWYLDNDEPIELHAACERSSEGVFAVVDDNGGRLDANLKQAGRLASASFHYPALQLDAPLMLETVRIDKPWGAEVWYTGIEQRGVCSVDGVPLPWITELGGTYLLGVDDRAPVLLKILDPLPDAVYGDLYFEMHEQKIEVYIVTDIDSRAWPDGRGAIRFGFDEGRLAACESRDEFTQAYAASVRAYEAVRREIDAAFDRLRAADGLAPGDVVRPTTIEAWARDVEPALIEKEAALREEMNSFTALQPLEIGDVVRVPPFTPHSLQHGVRVIEFQTPHYERYILSFAQKVLTQDHWDTEAAIDRIDWHSQFDKTLTTIDEGDGYTVEMAADFSAFEVHRVRLEAGSTYALPDTGTYALVISIYGTPTIGGRIIADEAAALLPAAIATSIKADSASCVLLALPRPGATGKRS